MDQFMNLQAMAYSWSRYMVYQTLEFTLVFAALGLIWLMIRRRVPVQFGYGLFVLLLIKLWVPSPLSLPAMMQNYVGVPGEALVATSSSDLSWWEWMMARGMGQASPSVERPAPGAVSTGVKTSPGFSLENAVFLIWLAIASGLLLRFLWIEGKTYRLIQKSIPIDPATFPLNLSRLQKVAQVKQPVQWRTAAWAQSPLAYGLFRPVVVIPPVMTEQFTANQLRWVLLHELAHIRRGDALVSIVQSLAQIVFFFNPLVWWLNAHIHQLREYSCDDEALARSRVSQSDCGESFLKVVMLTNNLPQWLPVGLGLIDYKTLVRNRLLRILDSNRTPSFRLSFRSLLGLLLLTLVVLPFGARMAMAQVGKWSKAEVNPTDSPSARVLHAMAYDETRGVVVLHGGSTGTTVNDTWEWNGDSWTRVSEEGPNLEGHGMAYDPVRKVMVVAGGYDRDLNSLNPNTWEWNGTTWTKMDAIDETPGISPALVYFPERKTIIRHGGFVWINFGHVLQSYSNTWEWDGQQWSPLPDGPALNGHRMVYDPLRRKIVVFGGAQDKDVEAGQDNLGYSNLTWEFDGNTWTMVSDQGPRARMTASLVYDSKRGVMVLFGGGVAGDPNRPNEWQSFNDMWQWDGHTWTEISNETLPSNRNLFSIMVYDAQREQMVLFGGSIDFGTLRPNETWLFNFASGMPSRVWMNY